MSQTDFRLTSITTSQSSSLMLSGSWNFAQPALLTSSVTGPSSATVRSTSAVTSSARDTSACTVMARRPNAATCRCVSAAPAAS